MLWTVAGAALFMITWDRFAPTLVFYAARGSAPRFPLGELPSIKRHYWRHRGYARRLAGIVGILGYVAHSLVGTLQSISEAASIFGIVAFFSLSGWDVWRAMKLSRGGAP